MPYPTEHAARIKNPSLFENESFRRKNIVPGIDVITAVSKSTGKREIQAYRFKVAQWTAMEAKQWLNKHKINYIRFEPAKK